MRNWMHKLTGGAIFGLGMAGALLLVQAAYAASLPLFVGPNQAGSGTVAYRPDLIPDLNQLVTAINNWGFFAGGATNEYEFTSAGSWSANGVVATTMTSLGPTGSHTTVQEWFTVVDSVGTVRYIPAY